MPSDYICNRICFLGSGLQKDIAPLSSIRDPEGTRTPSESSATVRSIQPVRLLEAKTVMIRQSLIISFRLLTRSPPSHCSKRPLAPIVAKSAQRSRDMDAPTIVCTRVDNRGGSPDSSKGSDAPAVFYHPLQVTSSPPQPPVWYLLVPTARPGVEIKGYLARFRIGVCIFQRLDETALWYHRQRLCSLSHRGV